MHRYGHLVNSLVFFCLRPKAKDLGIFIYLFLYHSILSIYKSIYQFIYQSIILYYLSKNVSNRLSINLSFYYINLQIYQNFYLSIYQSILYRRRPRSRYRSFLPSLASGFWDHQKIWLGHRCSLTHKQHNLFNNRRVGRVILLQQFQFILC